MKVIQNVKIAFSTIHEKREHKKIHKNIQMHQTA